MPSKLKSETARINGAKSQGPVTPEGRAKSSANSRTHGLAAKYVRFHSEPDEHFQLLHADYIDQFQPQTGVEADLVEVMVIARWRLRRLLALETHLFDTEMVRREKHIDKEFDIMGPDARLAYVFEKMADEGHAIAMVIRYEGSLNRSYDKAFKHLLVLQSRRDSPPPAPNKKIQNEPKPDPAEARPQGAVTNPESVANQEPATNHESEAASPRTDSPGKPQSVFSRPSPDSPPRDFQESQESNDTAASQPAAHSCSLVGQAIFLQPALSRRFGDRHLVCDASDFGSRRARRYRKIS